MNEDWRAFLKTQNANINNDTVLDFGTNRSEEQAGYETMVLADLSHYALFEASGEEAESFLQGQLSNDIRHVNENHSQLSAYCNPKGRALALFRIFKRNEHYFLQVSADISAATIKRLRMFILRSKVELNDVSETMIKIGVAGKNAVEKLAAHFSSVPQQPDQVLTENEMTIIRQPSNQPQFEICGPIENIRSLWTALQQDAIAIGKNSWDLLNIQAGVPDVTTATSEAFVPQMLNLQAINGLSFTKGCYPGQEVVARMQYLGKLKRRLYICQASTTQLPQPGDAVMSEAENEQKTGQVVTASWSGDNQATFLAVLQIEKAENSELHLESGDGAPIQLLELPYPLEKTEKS